MRRGVYRPLDRKIFNKTAKSTKSVNLSVRPMRGGIRL